VNNHQICLHCSKASKKAVLRIGIIQCCKSERLKLVSINDSCIDFSPVQMPGQKIISSLNPSSLHLHESIKVGSNV